MLVLITLTVSTFELFICLPWIVNFNKRVLGVISIMPFLQTVTFTFHIKEVKCSIILQLWNSPEFCHTLSKAKSMVLTVTVKIKNQVMIKWITVYNYRLNLLLGSPMLSLVTFQLPKAKIYHND